MVKKKPGKIQLTRLFRLFLLILAGKQSPGTRSTLLAGKDLPITTNEQKQALPP